MNNKQKSNLKHKWKSRGLIVDDYNKIYDIWLNTDKCDICKTELNNKNKCMEHSHKTGEFRGIVCRRCNKNMLDIKHKNNTSGHKNIYKDKRGYIYRKDYYGNKFCKTFNSKIDALCYKYIMLLKIKSVHN